MQNSENLKKVNTIYSQNYSGVSGELQKYA